MGNIRYFFHSHKYEFRYSYLFRIFFVILHTLLNNLTEVAQNDVCKKNHLRDNHDDVINIQKCLLS